MAITINAFKNDIFNIIKRTIKDNIPVHISTKEGNVVLISEEDYNGLIETLYLSSTPEMQEKLIEGKNTSIEESTPENEIKW
jgi:PHD/YefM family antitoxin component YafN of YafNO toxin-antitoxin module